MLREGYIFEGQGKLIGNRLNPGEGRGTHGIDSIFVKFDDATDFAILESKYRTNFTQASDPLNLFGQTKNGPQMSSTWIEAKIDAMRFGPHGSTINSLGDDLFLNGYNNRYMNVLNQKGDSFMYNLDNLGLQ